MLYLPRTLYQKLILLHINYNTILCIALKFILCSFFNIPLTLSLVRNTLALLFSLFLARVLVSFSAAATASHNSCVETWN
ncbi:hypothetical protein V1520DRAFT_207441 [Lipomyces starkeyi]